MIKTLLAIAPKGPRIEIGVMAGDTLALIADHDGETFGIDSFEGMPEPGPHDYKDGECRYPRWRLRVPIERARERVPSAILIRGFVPEILADAPQGPFAFAHLDIDHYATTAFALEWLWKRMLPGGILCCDDYFPHQDVLAAKALNERAALHPVAGVDGRKCWWVL